MNMKDKKILKSIIALGLVTSCLIFSGCDAGNQEGVAIDDCNASVSQQEGKEIVESKYKVDIESVKIVDLNNGRKGALVVYNWTNGTEERQRFATALQTSVVQNEKELEIVYEEKEGYNIDDGMKEIDAGGSQKIGIVYALEDRTDLSISVSELISLKDGIISKKTFRIS